MKFLMIPSTFLFSRPWLSRKIFCKIFAKHPNKQVYKCPSYIEGVKFFLKDLYSSLQISNYSEKIFCKTFVKHPDKRLTTFQL